MHGGKYAEFWLKNSWKYCLGDIDMKRKSGLWDWKRMNLSQD